MFCNLYINSSDNSEIRNGICCLCTLLLTFWNWNPNQKTCCLIFETTSDVCTEADFKGRWYEPESIIWGYTSVQNGWQKSRGGGSGGGVWMNVSKQFLNSVADKDGFPWQMHG